MSAWICGCDPEAKHWCKNLQCAYRRHELDQSLARVRAPHEKVELVQSLLHRATTRQLFPASAQGRKDHPVFTGVLMYFPDAIAAVARVSKKGNDQHNPGEPLRWAREKSTDQTDTATRHMMDHGVGTVKDEDGEYHLAKAAWRILAELQLTIERERA